jgi:hypothetical protein
VSASSARAGRLVWLALVGAAVAFLLWPKAPPGRSAPGERVLLDADVPMGSAGALLAFRVERPGVVEIDVDLRCADDPSAATHVRMGPPAPASPPAGGPYPPDPKTAFRWRIEGERTPPVRRTLFGVGTYAVHVEPKPVATGGDPPRIRVRVTAVP